MEHGMGGSDRPAASDTRDTHVQRHDLLLCVPLLVAQPGAVGLL
jgi:hypothetical protein